MHNSQNGAAVDAGGPDERLLASDCVGCHSASDGATWKDGVTGAPIVWNQVEPSFNTQKGLAGGNFYWVGAGDDTKGHNVYGISGQDTNLSEAPGQSSTCSSNSCHFSLANAPETYIFGTGGCQGCHYYVSHHDDSNNWYRFLKGHGTIDADDYVVGVEDNDWEQETDVNHNWYKGFQGPAAGHALQDTNSISSFCGGFNGCHADFHQQAYIGSASPWSRHPTDIALPTTGEYAAYQGYANYNAETPVAFTDPANPSDNTAIVMCLSCHRAHGSEQSDMLRWDYSTMIAGGGSNTTGCFVCHTTKDTDL